LRPTLPLRICFAQSRCRLGAECCCPGVVKFRFGTVATPPDALPTTSGRTVNAPSPPSRALFQPLRSFPEPGGVAASAIPTGPPLAARQTPCCHTMLAAANTFSHNKPAAATGPAPGSPSRTRTTLLFKIRILPDTVSNGSRLPTRSTFRQVADGNGVTESGFSHSGAETSRLAP
jgi:hypothetical protein